jgi:hypothetical protein
MLDLLKQETTSSPLLCFLLSTSHKARHWVTDAFVSRDFRRSKHFFSGWKVSKMARLNYGFVNKMQQGSVGSIPKAMLAQYENMQPGGAMRGGGRRGYEPFDLYGATGGKRKHRRRTGAKTVKRSKRRSTRSKRKKSGKRHA